MTKTNVCTLCIEACEDYESSKNVEPIIINSRIVMRRLPKHNRRRIVFLKV